MIERMLVATDRSDTASRAVQWAAEMSGKYAADLLVLQVVAPEHLTAEGSDSATQAAADDLATSTRQVCGERGRPLLVYDSDPADAIVRVCEQERVDLVVVGNVGMRDRTEFLLGSVPNRVSHNARCSVVIVNTALNGAGATPPKTAQAAAEPSDSQLLGRAAHVARIFARYGLRDVMHGGKDDEAERARRFRSALEELGPTFAKLGQILSTRPDLLPAAVVAELADLQDHVAPLTEAEVVAVMETELKVPWEDVFASIEPDPLASGTIAQVHRATLVGGERVVVKVQRPTAETEIRQDLGLLRRFAEKAANRPAFQQVVDVPAVIDHLSSSLVRELDFRHEAANIERMREVLAPFGRLSVPDVHAGLSTRRLLVMQEIQGIPLLEAPEGEARREAASQLVEAYYQQVLAAGFFHADPHPGNLMWWNDTIYLLDLGMVGEVDAGMRESLLLLLLLAFWREDTAFLAEAMLGPATGSPSADFDQDAFQEELASLMAEYRHVSLKELRLGPLLQQLTAISVRHRVRLPSSLALIGKAFGQMQLAAAELDPSVDPFAVAGSFYLRQLTGSMRAAVNPAQLFYEGQKLRARATRLLEGLERTLGVRGGTGLQVDFRGARELTAAIGLAGRRIAIGLAAATAIVGTAVTASAAHSAAWATAVFGAAAVLLTGGLLIDVFRHR